MDVRNPASFQAGHPVRRFFTSRWFGLVPIKTLFWRDMMLVGTGLNVVTSLASLAMLAAKLPLAAVLGIFFAPLPYNLFLAFAVWRTSEKRRVAGAFAYQITAVLWLLAAIVV